MDCGQATRPAKESIPDYLALVGDASDGYPGLPGWGAKSSAAVLAKFVHLESIPTDWREWRVNAASASALAHTLSERREDALLFRTLATLRTDIPLFDDIDQLRWNGPTPAFAAFGAWCCAMRASWRYVDRQLAWRCLGQLDGHYRASCSVLPMAMPSPGHWRQGY